MLTTTPKVLLGHRLRRNSSSISCKERMACQVHYVMIVVSQQLSTQNRLSTWRLAFLVTFTVKRYASLSLEVLVFLTALHRDCSSPDAVWSSGHGAPYKLRKGPNTFITWALCCSKVIARLEHWPSWLALKYATVVGLFIAMLANTDQMDSR